MNGLKTVTWTVLFILDLISLSSSGGRGRTSTAGGILVDGVLLLAFWLPLIYGTIIFFRSRLGRYAPVNRPSTAIPMDTSYPQQYKELIVEEGHPNPATSVDQSRRICYNHQRDTRFESYRNERTSKSSTGRPTTFIFLHRFGADAEGLKIKYGPPISSANKRQDLTWVSPNAPYNHEALTNAWYTHAFSPIPGGKSSQNEPTRNDGNTDEGDPVEGEILKCVEDLCSLIDEEIEASVDVKRIVIRSFTQGCAISLVAGLASRYGRHIEGVVGRSGYLPDGKGTRREMEGHIKVEEAMKAFLAHETKDMLVPVSFLNGVRRAKEAN
ncbi:putative acyl-protein thioesterase 1 [Amylocarpus encephaloides]|uniref:Acyl-protein thioesterase 1 n=1 Tax=Amylocarpus encephaloides TaxID=45428 RepID=A0A9P7YCU9_9HELO|nr:putative acyl-protein thioesterase 1 [Amylocarpus encephaloides]